MKHSYLWLVAAAAMVASGTANAGATVNIIGIQDGVPGTNCGLGNESGFLSGSVAEINFNGYPSTSCTGGTDAGPPIDDGVPASSFSTTLGTVGLSGDGEIVAGTNSGLAGAPWADNSAYLVVPGPNQPLPGSETLDLSGLTVGATYFGLYWGSVDGGNVLNFTLSDGSVVSISGADLPGAADSLSYNGANQTDALTNVFVDFETTGGATIQSVNFTDSPDRAFETDNIAFGNIGVPAPGALALLGLGLAGLGRLRRKTKAA